MNTENQELLDWINKYNNINKLQSYEELYNLKELNLDDNNIAKSPDSIGNLINLKELNLDNSLRNNNIVKYILFKELIDVKFIK